MGKHHASFEEAYLSASGKEEREKAVNKFFNRREMAAQAAEQEKAAREAEAERLKKLANRQRDLVSAGRRWAEDRKRNGPLDTRMGAPVDPADDVIIALVEALDDAEADRCYCDDWGHYND